MSVTATTIIIGLSVATLFALAVALGCHWLAKFRSDA